MNEQGRWILKLIWLGIMLAALGSQSAWSQLTSTDDDTSNPNCTLNWNDPDCWTGGVVPNNNGFQFAVTLNDPTPLNLDLSPTLNSLSISAGSSLDIASGRTMTILGDTGSGDRGTLTIDGHLSLQSTGSSTSLVFQDGTTIIDRASPLPPGSFSITSSGNAPNYIEGAGTTPTLIINNQSISFNGSIHNFDRLELNGVQLQTDVSEFQFNDLGQLVSTNSLFDATGSAPKMSFRRLIGDGSDTSTLRTSNGGLIELDRATMRNYSYDVSDGRVISRNTVTEDSVIDIGAGGRYEYEGRDNRVARTNLFTIGDDGEIQFKNASDVVLEAGTEFLIETGGKVSSLDTGNFTTQLIEGNGGDAVVFRSPSLLSSGTYSYDTNNSTRNINQGTGTLPRLRYDNQRMRITGVTRDLDEVAFNNSRVETNPGTQYTYDRIERLAATNTEFNIDGAGSRLLLRDLNADGTNTSLIRARNDGLVELDNSTQTRFTYDVLGARTVSRNTVTEDSVIDIGAGGRYEYEGRDNRVARTNLFTIGDDGEIQFKNASDVVLEAGTEFLIETGGKVSSLDTGNFTTQLIEGNGGDAVVFRSPSLPSSGTYSYDTNNSTRNIVEGTGLTARVLYDNQGMRITGVTRGMDEVAFNNSRVETNPGTQYTYDRIERLAATNTEFNIDGAGSRLLLRDLNADGTNTSLIRARNDGLVELDNSTQTRFTYDVLGARTVSRNTVTEDSVIDIGAGGRYEYEGRDNRVARTNLFTIGDDGEIQFKNASDVVLEAGTEFLIETGGKVSSLDTGNFTTQLIEGNGGDAVVFRSPSLPSSGTYSYDTNNSVRNINQGTGTLPRLRYDNQRMRITGVTRDLDEVAFNNSRVETNPGTQYTYDRIERLAATNTEFNIDGAGSRLLLRDLNADGTNTSLIRARNDGLVEQEDVFARRLRYDAEFGEIKLARTVVESSELNIYAGGVLSFSNTGNRLARSNNVNIDGGLVEFSNFSTSNIEDGTTINLNNAGRVNTNSSGAFTAVNFGGVTPDAVNFTSTTAPAPGSFSIASSINERNIWNGIGPAANLNFNNQAIQFSGKWQDFNDIQLTSTTAQNNSGTRFSYDRVNRITSTNSNLAAIGPNGRLEMNSTTLDGTDTTRIEAANGGTFFGSSGSFSNFDGVAKDGSVIQFNGSRVTDAVLATEGSGLTILNNVDTFRVGLTGNTQVGGQFTLGLGTTYANLSTDPAQATTIIADNGYTLEDRLGFANRIGNSLESADGSPVIVNGDISGSFSSDSGIGLNAGGSIDVNGGNMFLRGPSYVNGSMFAGAGSQVTVNGELNSGGTAEWNVDGGAIRVNAPITGSSQWTITDNGTVDIGFNLNLDAQNFNLSSGSLFLNGGKLKSETLLIGNESKVNVLSTLSTSNLSIALTDEAAWNLDSSTVVEVTGGEGAAIGDWSSWGMLEVAGLDQGNDPGGFLDNFEIPTLEIGAGSSVFLRDLLDNGNHGGLGGQTEALYVDTLVFQDGFSVLNVNGLNLYFNNLLGNQSQIINQAVPIPPAIWLFGSGLLGLIGISRRKKTF